MISSPTSAISGSDMAFMQRYTQAREALARIDEMQSQARYREAQVAAQSHAMLAAARKEQKEAELAADLAKYQSPGEEQIAAPPMGMLQKNQNPMAMQELKALNQMLHRNAYDMNAYRKAGNYTAAEKNESQITQIRARMTAIQSDAMKKREEEQKEIAAAGQALVSAPDNYGRNVAWQALDPDVQRFYVQKGLPMGPEGPVWTPESLKAVQAISQTRLSTAEILQQQRDERAAKNQDTDNQRADEAARRDAARLKLQQTAAAREAAEAKRRESGELTPGQKANVTGQVLNNAQQDFNKASDGHAKIVADLKLNEYESVANRAAQITKRIIRVGKDGKEYVAGNLDPTEQMSLKNDVRRMIDNFSTKGNSTQFQTREIESLTSTTGKIEAWLKSVGRGTASMDITTAKELNQLTQLMYDGKNAQAVEDGLRRVRLLKAQVPEEAKRAYGEKNFQIQGNVDRYLEYVKKIPGKNGLPRVMEIQADGGGTKIVIETLRGPLEELPQ